MNIRPNDNTSRMHPNAGGALYGRGCQLWRNLIPLLALFLALTLWPSTASAQEPAAKGPGSASGEAAAPSEEVDAQPAPAAPVLVGGEPAIWILSGIGPYTPEVRAERISGRLYKIIHDQSIQDMKVSVVEAGGSSELRIGQRLVMAVTKADAAAVGITRERLAREYGKDIEAAVRNERLRYTPEVLIRSSVYALISTIALAAMLWLIGNLSRRLQSRLRRSRWLDSLRVQKVQLVTAD